MSFRHKFVGSCSIAILSALLIGQSNLVQAEETTPPSDTTTSADTSVTSTSTPETTSESAEETEAQTDESTDATATDELIIIHTNDIHGRIEEDANARNKVIGLAKLDAVIKETKATNVPTLVLDAGDAFQGLPISNSSQGRDMANILNEIGYDAMAVGNHEFDFSLEVAKEYKELLNFPLLSTNTYIDDVRVFEPYTIIDKNEEVDGDEIVVIGVTTPETSTKTHPKNVVNVTFKDPITEVKSVIQEIESRAAAENKQYNRYIILAHLGIDETTPKEWRGSTLAEELSKYELLKDKQVVVIDGHSHTVAQAKFGENVAYNQTGEYLNNIGKVTFKSNQAIETAILSYEDVKDVTPSANIAELVAAARKQFDEDNSVVIVDNNPVYLTGDRENVRVRESNLGNLIADAMYDYGQTGFSNPTDIAVTNGGGIRASIAKDAPITKGDVIAVLPFGNTITQIAVTGQQIEEMFKYSLGSVLDKDGKTYENGLPLLSAAGYFLQISGARVYYTTEAESGDRRFEIQILDREKKGYVPLEADRTYYLATNDFLATGGDGYSMLGGVREEGPSLDSVFADYIKEVDLSLYAEETPQTRIIATEVLPSEKDNANKPTNNTQTNTNQEKPNTGNITKPDTNKENDTKQSGTSNVEQNDAKTEDDEKTKEQVEETTEEPTKEKTEETSTTKDTSSEVSTTQSSTSSSQPATSTEAKTSLPETGEAANYAVFSTATLAILASVGLVTIKKREEI